MVSSFLHHGDGAPQWRAWGPPTGPIPVPVRPYSGMRYCMMYIKAERRAKSIGGFIRDEMMIAMGDISMGVILLPSWRWSAPMARLGPTHGANTGYQAPIFGSDVLEDKGCAARGSNWGLRWGRNCDRHGRCGPKTTKNSGCWLEPVLKNIIASRARASPGSKRDFAII